MEFGVRISSRVQGSKIRSKFKVQEFKVQGLKSKIGIAIGFGIETVGAVREPPGSWEFGSGKKRKIKVGAGPCACPVIAQAKNTANAEKSGHIPLLRDLVRPCKTD